MSTRRSARPVLSLPLTLLDKILRAIALVSLLGLLGVAIWGLLTLPTIIPTHFGLNGQPDAYGNKANLLILPLIYLALYALLTFLETKPHSYNYPARVTEENAPRLYRLGRELLEFICAEVLLIGLIIQWGLVASVFNTALLLVLILGIVLLSTVLVYIFKLSQAART